MRASALGRVVTWLVRGVSSRKLMVPSMIISVKGVLAARSCLTARRVASLRLAESPRMSSSAALTQPVAVAAYCWIRGRSFSRVFAVSFLESVRWVTRNSRSDEGVLVGWGFSGFDLEGRVLWLITVASLADFSWSKAISSGLRMAAPTTSGPAQGPRPTSSIPNMVLTLLSFSFLGYNRFWSCFFNLFLFGNWKCINTGAIKGFIGQAS